MGWNFWNIYLECYDPARGIVTHNQSTILSQTHKHPNQKDRTPSKGASQQHLQANGKGKTYIFIRFLLLLFLFFLLFLFSRGSSPTSGCTGTSSSRTSTRSYTESNKLNRKCVGRLLYRQRLTTSLSHPFLQGPWRKVESR